MNPTQDMELAIQALAAAVTGLTAQIAATNAQPAKGSGPAGGGGGLGGFARVLAGFAAVAGPMAVLGAVMGSVTSGMATLGKAAQLLGTVLSPVLLPAAVLLGTAFVAVADVLASAGEPALTGFFTLLLNLGVPVIVTFVGMVQWAADQLKAFAEWVKRNTPDMGGDGNEAAAAARGAAFKRLYDEERSYLDRTGFGGSKLDRVMEMDSRGLEYRSQEDERHFEAVARANRRLAAGETGGGATRTDPAAVVRNALRDVVASVRTSVGPRAQIGGLEGIGRAAQLAALNQDPIEARMLKVQQQIAAALEQALARLNGGEPGYAPPSTPGEAGKPWRYRSS